MYKISEFSKMIGLPPSKVRFYEKYGLLRKKKESNGYTIYTHTDAFRVNAFRVLQQYGFTIEKSIEMLDEMQSGDTFIENLIEQREELKRQTEIMHYRLTKLNRVISLLQDGYEQNFKIMDVDEYIYVKASEGLDFSLSIQNADVIAQFAEILSITSYARVIKKEDLYKSDHKVLPSYVCIIPASKEYCLGTYNKSKVHIIKQGKCIRFYRQKTREESLERDSFSDLFEFIKNNHFTIRDDIFLLPTFLNLDKKGSDIEVLYVPIY